MSIIVDFQIREHINKGNIKVTPYDESLINPNSLDIRLGGNFSVVGARYDFELGNSMESEDSWKPNYDLYIDPLKKETIVTHNTGDDVHFLRPNQMVLASLLEDITLPDFICARIVGKSSLGRLGLDNSSVAGWVDAGWSGVLTIELFNHSPNIIKLTTGMKIGQMLFFETEQCEKPYGQVGRYQRQQAGQGSLGI